MFKKFYFNHMNTITPKIRISERPTLDNINETIFNFKIKILPTYGIVVNNISFICKFICYPNFLTIQL